ncbi:MAG TPA: hypothetical protein VJ044_07950, partial [Candidatus Hodarchaeales archaeon]|nr:hypothetical protein [Candidatus Hodarchaeales archaeon]
MLIPTSDSLDPNSEPYLLYPHSQQIRLSCGCTFHVYAVYVPILRRLETVYCVNHHHTETVFEFEGEDRPLMAGPNWE